MINSEKRQYVVTASYGVERDAQYESGTDPLPFDLVHYFFTADQIARRIGKELEKESDEVNQPVSVVVEPQLTLAAQDFGRLVKSMALKGKKRKYLDVDRIDKVLTGHTPSEEADRLLDIAADRESIIKATVEMLQLDTVKKVTSVIEMLIKDINMRKFHLDYLAAVVDNFEEMIFRGTVDETALRVASLQVLPKRLRTPADANNGMRLEDYIYPHTQAAFATYTVLEGGTYISPCGYESTRFRDEFTSQELETIPALRKITEATILSILSRSKIFATTDRYDLSDLARRVTDQKYGWRIEDSMMGLAYRLKPGKTGAAKSVDAYYWFENDKNGRDSDGGGLEENVGAAGTAETQLRLRPSLDPDTFVEAMRGKEGGIADAARREVIERLNRLFRPAVALALDTPIGCLLLRSLFVTFPGEIFSKLRDWVNGKVLLPGGDLKALGALVYGFSQETNERSAQCRVPLPKSIAEVIEQAKASGLLVEGLDRDAPHGEEDDVTSEDISVERPTDPLTSGAEKPSLGEQTGFEPDKPDEE